MQLSKIIFFMVNFLQPIKMARSLDKLHHALWIFHQRSGKDRRLGQRRGGLRMARHAAAAQTWLCK
jgi:hypothetical protein